MKFKMILGTTTLLDKLYIEVVRHRVLKKYSCVKDMKLDKNKYILTVSFKDVSNIEVFGDEYYNIRSFIEGLFPTSTAFGDFTYDESMRGRELP